jgi:molecular chaperone DnaK (HSP70)
MGRCIGIDLGTTNSVAAIREGAPRVLQNRESLDLTRSVVGEYKSKILVGELALDRQLMAPKDTVESIKRLMGRGFRDENVQRLKEKAVFAVVEPSDGTDDDVRVVMGGKEYSPIQISSMILKKVKDDAEMRLNDVVEYAVITVPAYFTDKQKDATRKAGRLAGLKVQKILEEPTAAAIAFGVENVGPEDSETILVYDLGGGTFDVSIMTIVGGSFVTLNIEGDMWLGGDDFDRKIMDHVLRYVSTVYGVDGTADTRFMTELKKKAEQAKRALSTMTRTDIIIPGMLKDDDGNLISVELDISRTEFEGMIATDVARSMAIVETAMKNAGEAMTADQIDHVLVVGGSSYIPLVQSSLAARFGREKLMMGVDPMKCVAYGAAILSAKWSEAVECRKGHVNPGKNTVCEAPDCGEPLDLELTIADGVTGMPYGIRTKAEKVTCSNGHENPGKNRRCCVAGCEEELTGADDCYEEIIPKGASFPTPEPVKRRFSTPAANLKRLRVAIYAGSDRVASKNDLQATVWLELPDHVSEDTPVEVFLSLDGDGILNKVLVALLDGSGTRVETYLDRGDGLRSLLEKKLEQLKRRKDEAGDTLDPEGKMKWEELYGKATKALSANDTAAASSCADRMEKLLQAGGDAWKRRAKGLCGYTELVLGHSFLLDPPKTQQLKTLVKELQASIDRDDEAGAEQKYKELDEATDDLPDMIKLLMMLIRAVGIAKEKGLGVESDNVLAAYHKVESALRANDPNRAAEISNSIGPILGNIFGAANQDSGQTDKKIEDVPLRGPK